MSEIHADLPPDDEELWGRPSPVPKTILDDDGEPFMDYGLTLAAGCSEALNALNAEVLRLEKAVANWQEIARSLANLGDAARAAYVFQVKAHGLEMP